MLAFLRLVWSSKYKEVKSEEDTRLIGVAATIVGQDSILPHKLGTSRSNHSAAAAASASTAAIF